VRPLSQSLTLDGFDTKESGQIAAAGRSQLNIRPICGEFGCEYAGAAWQLKKISQVSGRFH
jgi:hypothetical protein